MNRLSILFIHPGALGDVVLGYPALKMIREAEFNVHFMGRFEIARLVRQLNLADEILPFESAESSVLFGDPEKIPGETVRRFKSFGRIFLVAQSEALFDTLDKITGGKTRQLSPRPKVADRVHVADHLMRQMIKDNGIFDPFNRDRSPANKMVTPADSCSNQHRILLHPGSGSRRKNWPVQNFVRTAKLLKNEGFDPEFLLGPAEQDKHLEILRSWPDQNAIPPVHTPHKLTDLLELLLAFGHFIGNDSGVSHLAAYCSVHTLVVFGPSDPLRWHPVGPRVTVLNSNSCTPCFEIEPANCPQEMCLCTISPDDVLKAFFSSTEV
jgi:ADP-heptose:LPS heptosyltransferase